MAKIDTNILHRALLTVLYTKDGNHANLDDIYTWIRGHWPGWKKKDDTQLAVRHVCDYWSRENEINWDVVIQALVSEIMGGGDHATDPALIDTMVEILQRDRGRMILGGKTLDQLRKAVLLPGERSAFAARARTKALCCVGCGREFTQGELGTFNQGDFYCQGCVTGQVTFCMGCKESAPLHKSVINHLQKANCGCKDKPKKETEKNPFDAQITYTTTTNNNNPFRPAANATGLVPPPGTTLGTTPINRPPPNPVDRQRQQNAPRTAFPGIPEPYRGILRPPNPTNWVVDEEWIVAPIDENL